MTSVLGLSSYHFTAMVSDRLVTLVDQRSGRYRDDHDPLANKTLVLLTTDAIVSIGYCGSAYVDGKPTDNWIAETSAAGGGLLGADGSPSMFGGKRTCKLRLHQICNRLRRGLAQARGGLGVTIMMVGWRVRRHRCTPIHLVFGASARLAPLAGLTMRPAWPYEARFGFIGAPISGKEMQAALSEVPSNVLIDRNGAIEFLTKLVRSKAGIEKTVGSHTMSVTIPHPRERRVVCSFDPLEAHYREAAMDGRKSRLLVAYSPWIITPGSFHAPTEATGDPGSGASWEADGWTIEMQDVPRAAPTPSNFAWAKPQQRKPLPGAMTPKQS
jgi:hypothetical protein